MPSPILRWICTSIAALTLITHAFAQGGATGAISGIVQDQSGAVLSGADVQITNQDTKILERTLKTDAEGAFTAPLLPVGTYTVKIQGAGFAQSAFPNIVVRVTETTRLIAKLNPQSVQQHIEVQAEVQTVDTTDATTGQAIEPNTIRSLPLATQNFQQLLSLSSGAQSDLNRAADLGRGGARIEVNGQRDDNNNYSIEGISATDYNVAELTNTPLPSPDVVQEFKVQTSLYDATQGRNGGGNINAILKSGTNEFHGDVFEFFRNTVLDANEYFIKGTGSPRPVIQQSIFGGSFGGPVSSGGKLGFFFVNYQGTRQRSGESAGSIISTFIPYVPASLRGPSNAAALAAAFGVPSADPVAVSLLAFKSNQFGPPANGYLFPLPNVPAGTAAATPVQFTVSKPGSFTDDQFTTSWDHDFRNSADKVSVRFFFSNAEQLIPFGAGGLQASLGAPASSSDLDFPYDLPLHDRVLSIAETHLFSPTLVNDFRFGLVHINNSGINVNPVTASDAGIDRPTNNVTSGIYKFTFLSSGFQFGPTPSANQFQTQNNYNFVENLSWVHGKQTLTFGGQFVRVNLSKQFPQVFNGELFFTGSGGISDFGTFVEGQPPFAFGGGGVFNHAYRQNDSAVFAQDDWKATSNLTLNLGLRTEFLGAWTDGDCHIANIQSNLTNSGTYPFIYPSCVNKLGVPGLTGNAAGSTFNNSISTGLGPRFGFAWDVFGRHKTTVRGGYGIYYVREDVGAVDQLSFQAPFIPIVAFTTTPGFTMANFFTGTPATNANAIPPAGKVLPAWIPCLSQLTGFVDGGGNPTTDTNQTAVYGACKGPGVDPTATNLFVLEVPRHFRVPNTQQWNLTIQRELAKQWVLEVGYVGTRGIHLRETRDAIQSVNATPTNPFTVQVLNAPPLQIKQNTFANAVARTPTPGLNGYSGYQIFANDAYSIYHSLQATLSRRWGQSYFQAAYTYSKNIDATSTGNTAFNTAYNDQSNINASRGISDFNRPHVLKVSYVYELPFAKGTAGLKRAALAGWAVSGVSSFQSGIPFSIFDANAGTAFLAAGSTPLLGASLAPGATVASGLTHGDIHQRLNGYLNPGAFVPAPLLYPFDPANPTTTCDPTNPSTANFCTTGFGDLGRNIYHGPFQQNWDFSVLKHFQIGERQDVRFTADFFNLWNHANFANPVNTTIEGGSAFGQIISTNGNPRLIQFSLRWAF
ncbi:MAG TPA: carboxypeptidase-like regulatory domain-containing protein [Candidatus Sulfotelmatobacter sp.]|nr:carboxypeptidase-like regulatory domain-containing protein [Candidatus Sulfotelmatobacter sp.]